MTRNLYYILKNNKNRLYITKKIKIKNRLYIFYIIKSQYKSDINL